MKSLRSLGDDETLLVQSGKPVAVFPWREGQMRCLAMVTAADAFRVGAALAHDRFIRLEVTQRRDRGDPFWEWQIR